MQKRIISWILVVMMVVGMMPMNALAADPTATDVKAAASGGFVIDFTNPADADKFEIVNNTNDIGIVEGTGLKLTTSRPAFEPCNGQNSGDQATNPEEVVEVPVSGDWTATLTVDFSAGSARNGYYQFFGFYASEGDEYQNMAGIRGGDGDMQDFLRTDGELVADTDGVKSAPGFASAGTYYLQIVKEGTTYTCNRSEDGMDFTEMFVYEDTGIEADAFVIDAYTGMTTGYEFTLKSLVVEQDAAAASSFVDFTNPADAEKFEIVNNANGRAIVEGEGLKLVTSRPAFEPCNGRNEGDQATNPEEVVEVPVSGNWTATLVVDFSTGSAANGYYQFFGFYASEGNDYQNMAGIRGGDGALQDFLRTGGELVADTDGVKSTPGFASAGTYYLQIVKEGTTYTCNRSEDGMDFTEMFAYEDTGIEADKFVIDAYTGMTTGYEFTLKSLDIQGQGSVAEKPTFRNMEVKANSDKNTFSFSGKVKLSDGAVVNAVLKNASGAVVWSGTTVVTSRAFKVATELELVQGEVLTLTLTADGAQTLVTDVVVEATKTPIYEDTNYSFAERAADLVARMSVSQKGSQMISSPAPAIKASDLGGGTLNVPATKDLPQYYWWNEALHGYNRIDNGASVRGGGAGPSNATSYPQSLTVGSTYNPDLYYREALEVSDEIRERTSRNTQTGNAIDLNFYSPTVNLQRDPRWGRNEEAYSEDPYLTTKMGSQYVLGLEGKNQDGTMIDPDGYFKIHSTIKHYVANNSEYNRLNGGATTSLKALRDYYVAPYRNIIRATDVTSVMTAYSTLNKEPCSYSSYLMDTLLRQTFGFSGFITSDCDSVGTMSRHNYVNPHTGKTLTDVERLAGALAHGEDLECNGGYRGTGSYSANANQMVNGNIMTDKGLFTENSMDISLHRLLTARISTGEFDEDLALTAAANERIAAQKAADSSAVYNQTEERLAIMDQVNEEGVVLLQNTDNFLPLNIPETGAYTAVIVGSWQTDMYLGLYSANASNSAKHVNIQKGITNAIKAVNPNATVSYITSNTISANNEATIKAADVVVVVAGTGNSYSAEDRDRSSIALPNNMASVISQVGKLNPNTIAVMETCGPMEVATFANDVKAILWSSFGGLHKGVGFGNIITGAVNPSGKVTATWYKSNSDILNISDYTLYNGRTYMYYTGTPQYPFGYGLSFTTFAYSNLKINKTAYDANDTVTVTFDVTNTGKVAGKEVTQLYIAQPDAPAALNRPIKRLEGFDKIELQPGEKKTVTMQVAIPDLAFYDEADDCFKVDTGKYQVQVGTNSAEAVNLTADFTVSGKMDVYPTVLTVKANAKGDTEKKIEERLIYAKGDIINPQLTVAMNDESLHGYIIADQQSPIKSLKSNDLPAGMKFTYESNRPSVVAVNGNEIKAVGAGVATVTVTGTLDGHTVTADFVVYVESTSSIDGIKVDGKEIAGFDSNEENHEVLLPAGSAMPTVEAVYNQSELNVTVNMPTALPGVATITATNKNSGASSTYKVGLGFAPVTTDFTAGWAAAQAKGWSVSNGTANAKFDTKGLSITTESGSLSAKNAKNLYSMSAFGNWAAQTKVTVDSALTQSGTQIGLVVMDDTSNYVALVYEYANNAPCITAYNVVGGTSTQVSRAAVSGAEFELRIVKQASTYKFGYAVNGTWTDLSGTANNRMAAPKLGPVAAGGSKAATFDGINLGDMSDIYPQLAELKVNGQLVAGFSADKYSYDIEIADGTKAPKVEATAVKEGHTVEISKLDTAAGTVTVTVKSGSSSCVYTLNFNYGPIDDYFADGSMSSRWEIVNEDKATYNVTKGEGLVLPTQEKDFYQDGTDYKNVFTLPAMGTWQIVVKAFYPKTPTANYQQALVAIWENDDNYLRINCQQSTLKLEPGVETDGKMDTNVFKSANAKADADGSVTIYYRINKIGDEYNLAYSQDGAEFTDLGSATVALSNPKLVLCASQNSTNEPINVNFEYVAVTSRDGVDANMDFLTWACQNVADYVAADLPAIADKDLTLSKVPHGYTVSLTSDDPSVIAADGKVTKAAADKTVAVSVTVSDGTKSATSKAVSIKVPASGAVDDFVDVTPNRYYYNAVKWAVDKGITTGVDENHFAPNDDCTRAQAVMFLWNAAGCPEVAENVTNPFTDVKESRYYYKAVLWAISTGITDGTDATHFSPNKKLNRGTFVTFLWRAMGKVEVPLTDTFTDVEADKFYAPAVAWAVANGITDGKTATTFAPSEVCTRAQVVTFLQRAYDK